MRLRIFALVVTAILAGVSAGRSGTTTPPWALNATAIEACSCPMFCQCYFNSKPAHHHEENAHYCKFNMAYHIDKGNYGGVKLDGTKFWVSGDLGPEFGGGQTDWGKVTFDKSMTKEQREALGNILPHVFPVKWKSFDTAEGSVDTWQHDANGAHATLDGGKSGEIKLTAAKGNAPGPVVMKNLKYWGVPRNDGFIMMPSELEAYRIGDKPFEYKGTNGFMITIHMNSKDVPPAKPAM